MTGHAVRACLAILAAGASMGNHSCDLRTPTLACESGRHVELTPGSCVEIANPCEDGQWAPLPQIDGFRFEHAPEGLSLSTAREAGATRRLACAALDAPEVQGQLVDYVFGHGSEIGRGTMRISVHANPRLQLAVEPVGYLQWHVSATVSGGSAPYRFQIEDAAGGNPGAWTPDPVFLVTGEAVRVYRVTVADVLGRTDRTEVTVGPGPSVTFDRSATTIVRGDAVTIAAIVTGGQTPFTFAWAPDPSIVLASGAGIVAGPQATTTFTVTVTDATGARVTASTTITVVDPPPPSTGPVAMFTFSHCCTEVLRLDASASTGDIVSYAWDFSWVPMNPEIVTNTPTAQYFAFVTTAGTIALTVTDRAGRTATLTRPFTLP